MTNIQSYYATQYRNGFRYIHTWGAAGNQTAMFRTNNGLIQNVLDRGQHYTASFNAEGKLTRIQSA